MTMMDRRNFLRTTVAASAGLIAAPGLLSGTASARAAAMAGADPMLPFIDHYMTNLSANLAASTDAAVDILSGMAELWQAGTTWDNGIVLAPDILFANMAHSVEVTTNRTEADATPARALIRLTAVYPPPGFHPRGGPLPCTDSARHGADQCDFGASEA